MMREPKFWQFTREKDLLAAFISDLTSTMRQDLREDFVSLVLPGGQTPIPLYTALSKDRFPWQYLRVTLSDERWVETSSPLSNEGLLKQIFLQGPPGEYAEFVSLKNSAPNPALALPAITKRLNKKFPRFFSAVVLGIGEDGHIAGLLPTALNSRQFLKVSPENVRYDEPVDSAPCVALTEFQDDVVPYPGVMRLSLSLERLLRTKSLFLYFSGVKKLAAYQRALKEIHTERLFGTPIKLPLSYLLKYSEKMFLAGVKVYYKAPAEDI